MLTEVSLFKNLKQKVSFFVQSLSLNKCVNRTGRKLALTLTDILTLSLFRHTAQITTKKKLWELFELPCSYKTLVVNINRFFELALTILMLILKYNRKNCHLVKHIDSTDIPVCSLRKSDSHRVMKEFATLGKTGKVWFYGLKLHLIADLEERIRGIFAKARSNMKQLATKLDTFLYGTRMRIELNFRNLKCFFGLITSLPRSVAGYLANYTYAILSYVLG